MIKIQPTDEQLREARRLANKMGAIRNSHYEGYGNFVGFIGELCVGDYLNAKQTPCKDYDITTKNGVRIDVKSKKTTVEPKKFYECTVYETSKHQRCDVYVFTRYLENTNTLYILGYKDKDSFFKQAKFVRKGTVDGTNRFKVPANCYNLPISELDTMRENND